MIARKCEKKGINTRSSSKKSFSVSPNIQHSSFIINSTPKETNIVTENVKNSHTMPVYNIHVHIHPSPGRKVAATKAIQPIFHFHFDDKQRDVMFGESSLKETLDKTLTVVTPSNFSTNYSSETSLNELNEENNVNLTENETGKKRNNVRTDFSSNSTTIEQGLKNSVKTQSRKRAREGCKPNKKTLTKNNLSTVNEITEKEYKLKKAKVLLTDIQYDEKYKHYFSKSYRESPIVNKQNSHNNMNDITGNDSHRVNKKADSLNKKFNDLFAEEMLLLKNNRYESEKDEKISIINSNKKEHSLLDEQSEPERKKMYNVDAVKANILNGFAREKSSSQSSEKPNKEIIKEDIKTYRRTRKKSVESCNAPQLRTTRIREKRNRKKNDSSAKKSSKSLNSTLSEKTKLAESSQLIENEEFFGSKNTRKNLHTSKKNGKIYSLVYSSDEEEIVQNSNVNKNISSVVEDCSFSKISKFQAVSRDREKNIYLNKENKNNIVHSENYDSDDINSSEDSGKLIIDEDYCSNSEYEEKSELENDKKRNKKFSPKKSKNNKRNINFIDINGENNIAVFSDKTSISNKNDCNIIKSVEHSTNSFNNFEEFEKLIVNESNISGSGKEVSYKSEEATKNKSFFTPKKSVNFNESNINLDLSNKNNESSNFDRFEQKEKRKTKDQRKSHVMGNENIHNSFDNSQKSEESDLQINLNTSVNKTNSEENSFHEDEDSGITNFKSDKSLNRIEVSENETDCIKDDVINFERNSGNGITISSEKILEIGMYDKENSKGIFNENDIQVGVKKKFMTNTKIMSESKNKISQKEILNEEEKISDEGEAKISLTGKQENEASLTEDNSVTFLNKKKTIVTCKEGLSSKTFPRNEIKSLNGKVNQSSSTDENSDLQNCREEEIIKNNMKDKIVTNKEEETFNNICQNNLKNGTTNEKLSVACDSLKNLESLNGNSNSEMNEEELQKKNQNHFGEVSVEKLDKPRNSEDDLEYNRTSVLSSTKNSFDLNDEKMKATEKESGLEPKNSNEVCNKFTSNIRKTCSLNDLTLKFVSEKEDERKIHIQDLQLEYINKEMVERNKKESFHKMDDQNTKNKKRELDNNVPETSNSKKKKMKYGKKEKSQKSSSSKKKFPSDEDYIPLNVSGSTKFAVAPLSKVKPYQNHDAMTFRDKMLFGNRIKRFSDSKDLQIYKLKQDTAKKAV